VTILKASAAKGSSSLAAREDRGVLFPLPLDRRQIRRRREEIDNRIQERLDPFVLEGGAAADRDDLHGEGLPPERGENLLAGENFALQVFLRDRIVEVRKGLNEPVPGRPGLVPNLGRQLPDGELRPESVDVVHHRLHVDKIDDPPELVFGADRDLDRNGIGTQPLTDHLDGLGKLGAHPIHLVDECDAGHAVAVGLPPDRFGLGLDTLDSRKEGHGPVEDTQRAFHLDGEIHVAGRVDDVDAAVAPGARRGSRGDRDPPLLLLLHEVHDGRAVVDLSHLVGDARVVEDALGHGRLARIDVSHDTDVTDVL
jgi:hypothetical protein